MDPDARLAWTLTAVGATLAARVLGDVPSWLLDPRAPVVPLCLALGLAALLGALSVPLRVVASPALASTRLALALTLATTWRAEGRELWGALALYVSLHDAERGLCPSAPMLPAGVALAFILAWGAFTRGEGPMRAVLLALLAAAAASWGHQRARPR